MSIKKIAKMTGASISTVSRVLNDPEYHCRDEGMREKIWNAAMEMDYTPNEAARNLRLSGSKKSEEIKKIQVLMTHTDEESADPFFTELLRIVESQIHYQGCALSGVRFLPKLSEKSSTEAQIRDLVKSVSGDDQPDGLIIIGKCRKDALKKLLAQHPCIVAINRNSVEFAVDEVTCDGSKLAAIAVGHLIKLGHTKIAYAGEVLSESRYQGYLDTLEKHGIKPGKSMQFELPHTRQAGIRLADRLLRMKSDRPTAVFCANDTLAIGILEGLEKRKSSGYIPSVIGCDDIEEAQNTNPMLSSVHVPKEEMGYLATRLLCDRMNGGHKSASKLELLGYLMQRSSTQKVR